MADSNSGRNRMNSGSDSAVHFTGTAHQRYQTTAQPGKASGDTGKLSNGYVGNGKPGKADPRSIVKT